MDQWNGNVGNYLLQLFEMNGQFLNSQGICFVVCAIFSNCFLWQKYLQVSSQMTLWCKIFSVSSLPWHWCQMLCPLLPASSKVISPCPLLLPCKTGVYFQHWILTSKEFPGCDHQNRIQLYHLTSNH